MSLSRKLPFNFLIIISTMSRTNLRLIIRDVLSPPSLNGESHQNMTQPFYPKSAKSSKSYRPHDARDLDPVRFSAQKVFARQ